MVSLLLDTPTALWTKSAENGTDKIADAVAKMMAEVEEYAIFPRLTNDQ